MRTRVLRCFCLVVFVFAPSVPLHAQRSSAIVRSVDARSGQARLAQDNGPVSVVDVEGASQGALGPVIGAVLGGGVGYLMGRGVCDAVPRGSCVRNVTVGGIVIGAVLGYGFERLLRLAQVR